MTTHHRITEPDRHSLDTMLGVAMLEEPIAQKLLLPEWRGVIISEHCTNPRIQRDLQSLPRLKSLEDFASHIMKMYHL